jgi:hypothetical protein
VLTALAFIAMVCAAVPAALFCANLRLYREPEGAGDVSHRVSVLIPARNEEAGIEAAVDAVLRSVGLKFEVVVMDDCSTDRTAEIVAAVAKQDKRVRLVEAPVLPAGWNGKQHACWALAQSAQFETLCFVDADVSLEPDALPRMAAFMERQDAALVSGFPRQITGTWMEWMLLPLIHFVLLGFLPLARMRSATDPAFAAGCGQFMMVRREAYFAAGGHAAIRRTMHDGLLLPRLLRRAGFRTDLADMTRLAKCRMYTDAAQVWHGLAKNATEGLGAPSRIVPVSLLLILGQVMPALWIALLGVRDRRSILLIGFAVVGIVCAWLPRVIGVRRFMQDWRGAALHPLGVLLLLALQWSALVGKLRGRAAVWKERSYSVS